MSEQDLMSSESRMDWFDVWIGVAFFTLLCVLGGSLNALERHRRESCRLKGVVQDYHEMLYGPTSPVSFTTWVIEGGESDE